METDGENYGLRDSNYCRPIYIQTNKLIIKLDLDLV